MGARTLPLELIPPPSLHKSHTILVCLYITRNRNLIMSSVSHYHNASAYPPTPIINFPPHAYNIPGMVHWWNEHTAVYPASYVHPNDTLPSCGFFPPSASFTLLDEGLPWTTSTPSESGLLNPTVEYDTISRRTVRPHNSLARVRTINKIAGQAIITRRNSKTPSVQVYKSLFTSQNSLKRSTWESGRNGGSDGSGE